MTTTFTDDPGFEALSQKISRERGFGCSGYKERCLRRRIAVRMRARGVHRFADYSAVLDGDPLEYERLLDALTINVTKLFRNWTTYDAMARLVVPVLWRAGARPVRVWSAGCSSGEEPYSLSIALHNAGLALAGITWEIDACDLNVERVARAQEAVYAESSLRACDADARRKYFVSQPGGFRLRDKYRTGVRVFHANLMAPNGALGWSVYDAILCRNLLIYVSDDAFATVIGLFARSLLPGGYLFLGHSESLLDRKTAFAPAMVGGAVVYRKLEAA